MGRPYLGGRKASQARWNEKRRKLYHSDPTFKESRLVESRARSKAVWADPEKRKVKAAYARGWRKNNPEYKETAKIWRQNNRQLSRDIVKRNRREIRAEFLKAYGGVCTCCGEDESTFLTCEHRFGDGGKIRKKLGGDIAVLRDLRDRGWPKDEGITIYCWNCNSATRFGRPCPHEIKRNASSIS